VHPCFSLSKPHRILAPNAPLFMELRFLPPNVASCTASRTLTAPTSLLSVFDNLSAVIEYMETLFGVGLKMISPSFRGLASLAFGAEFPPFFTLPKRFDYFLLQAPLLIFILRSIPLLHSLHCFPVGCFVSVDLVNDENQFSSERPPARRIGFATAPFVHIVLCKANATPPSFLSFFCPPLFLRRAAPMIQPFSLNSPSRFFSTGPRGLHRDIYVFPSRFFIRVHKGCLFFSLLGFFFPFPYPKKGVR